MFPESKQTEAVFRWCPESYLVLPAELCVGIRVTQLLLVLKVLRGHGEQLRLAAVWQERLLVKM